MTALHLKVPSDHLDRLALDRLPLDRLPLDRLPFVSKRPARRRRRALVVGLPVLGLVAALLAYWRRTRPSPAQEYLEADLAQQRPDGQDRVGLSRSEDAPRTA
jgi:hypothetical protein